MGNWFSRQRELGRGHVKLNEDKVSKILLELAKKRSCASVAEEYGVAPSTISAIKSGLAWAQVERPVEFLEAFK